MGDLFKAAEVARTWTSHRQTVRDLFGDRYPAKIGPWRDVVRAEAAKHGGSIVDALNALGKRSEGMQLLMLIAAGLDEFEEVRRG